MHVKLKPLSQPQLEEILIQDPLFPIGRDEEPFSRYDKTLVANLSRRHARIFQEAGNLYVTDVGSRNGTSLNAKPVDQQPVKVHQGDKLSFAGKLNYEVDIIDESVVPTEDLPILTLVPKGKKSKLETLVVSSFPFLIGKSASGFAEEVAVEPEVADYLSRRHAHIFVHGNQLCIEDLGSANGTYVNGERLGEHAHPMHSGDEIAFGASDLAFVVKLKKRGAEADAKTDKAATESDKAGASAPMSELASVVPEDQKESTIFVSSANSFLDIFCAADEEEVSAAVEQEESEQVAEEDAGDSENIKTSGGKPKRALTIVRFYRRLRTFSKEVGQALSEQEGRNPQRKWWFLATVGVLVTVAVALYLEDAPRRQIEQSLKAGQYWESARLAKDYLQQNPGSESVSEWATEALLKAVLPEWLQHLQGGRYSAAQTSLSNARNIAVEQSESGALLELLDWITQLHQYINGRGGVNAPLQMYTDEAPIERLWRWWDQADSKRRQQMQRLLDAEPGFENVHTLTFSYLRALESDRSVYISAIDKLKGIVDRKLDEDAAVELTAVFSTFADQYPRISGLDLLRDDLDNYLSLQKQLEQLAPGESAQTALDSHSFVTEPFRRRYQVIQSDLGKQLAVDERVDIATPSESSASTGVIPDHNALPRAQLAWQMASARWKAYLQEGGIRGALRLEDSVSVDFRRRAQLLSQARSQAEQGLMLYQSLQRDPSFEQRALYDKIRSETQLQRRSLRQLSMVLDPALLEAKLGLLVEPANPAGEGGAP